MMGNSNFFEHYKVILVEGFNLQSLLNQCQKSNIMLREIRVKNDMEMTLKIMGSDYNRFLRLVRNRYRVTIISENGCRPMVRKLLNKKSAIVGMILFVLIMYYQSAFISEIRIFGYEKFTEAQVRESLKEAGFYEGCSKNIPIDGVKLHLYNDLKDLAWVGISYVGNLAEVTIAEGTKPTNKADVNKPAHVVAAKDGYIERVTAKDGFSIVSQGAFVKAGDVVISGIVPITSTAYGTSESALTERYVHASGEIQAKVPYRFIYHEDRYALNKKPTGKIQYGVRFQVGNFQLNTIKLMNQWETSVYTEKKLLKWVRPIPVNLYFAKSEEVTLSRHERTEKEVQQAAERLMRQTIKEKVEENSQILNKGLKFSPEENIIEIAVMLEVLEQIGKEEEFVIGEPAN